MLNRLKQLEAYKKQLESHYLSERAKQETLLEERSTYLVDKTQLETQHEECLLKKEILDQASIAAREQGKAVFENVVTNSLQMVFGPNTSAKIELGRKSNTPTAELLTCKVRDGKVIETDPCEEDGGGVADIVGTSAFMSTALLSERENVAPFFLDEPTKYVSAQHAEASAYFIKSLVDYTNRQTFLTTHEKEYLPFVADATHLVALDEKGVSHVSRFAEKGTLVLPTSV